MRKVLQQFCRDSFPEFEDIRITEPESVSEGWESDVYAFDLEHGSPGDEVLREMILRVYPGNDAYEKSYREFHGMKKLHSAGYPVPDVFTLSRDQSPLGKPFMIMERITGQGMWHVLSSSTEERQMQILSEFCELEAGLHSLDWRILEDEDTGRFNDPWCFIDEYLDMGRHFLNSIESAGFKSAMCWLEERRDSVPCGKPCPVHLDFHPANVIIRDDGKNFVIDWTQVSVSDLRFDLSWTMLLMSTHMERKWRDLVLNEYQKQSGSPVDSIEYFEVFSCVKRLLSIYLSLNAGPESFGMRPEAAAIMKQQMGATGRVYSTLIELTGTEITEIEDMLERYQPSATHQ
ncbi:MAG: phosphotransferase [Candidatus Aegiribacteria sp.]|nr:phosphotransferase [Candidatus Aegiribacteria sp.]